jgi:hypothetical protein
MGDLHATQIKCSFNQLKKMLDLEGQAITSPNGHLIQSPYMAIINKQALLILKTAAVLGFTPASRARLDIEPELDPDNPFAIF